MIADEQTRTARSIPFSINIIVVTDDQITLRQVPFEWCIFDARSWAQSLLDWHRHECQSAYETAEWDIALYYREIADDIWDWLIAANHPVRHPLLASRLSVSPAVVDQDNLVSYINCVMDGGMPTQDDLIDAVLLLDGDGGAMYTTANALIHAGEAVDVEIVDEGAMRIHSAPFISYLRDAGEVALAKTGGE